ncbi:putative protein [Arabidopsis thaliana]|uniref:Uncharacterized protein T22D6_50 n=1 Tax=Arabidopsis thaliana TaxID=3702 RepID=Q9LEZ5_ARATH|nr:putative protein [Arabidopsis thaliana]
MENERRSGGGDSVPISVRSINGESTTVQVSSDGTIRDLKKALKSCFPPASSSSNFHLYIKGEKLKLDTRVAAITINDGDILGLFPFKKKELRQTPKPDLSKPSSLSSRTSTMKDENAKRAEDHCVGEKRKRDEEACPYGFFNDDLESECKDAFKGQNTEKLAEVLKSRNCLTSPGSTKCLMSWDSSSSLCSCPDWESLSRLAMSGVRVRIQDVKNLSVICPKVITDDYEAVNYENAIVIADYLEMDEKSGRKKIPLAKLFSAMKKREASFKSDFWESIRSLLNKNTGESGIAISLEGLLKFASEGRADGGNEARQAGKGTCPTSGSRKFQTLCHATNSLLPSEMVEHLRNGIGSKGQVVHVEVIKARKSAYVEMSDKLSETTKSALKRIGLNTLYSHQAEAISAALAGKNVAVATMTSSGKSLCYNVPVFEELCKDTNSCALYLFPTKALAQDQLRALSDLIKGFEASINMGVYDGDTPYKDRTRLRSNARLELANLSELELVTIDGSPSSEKLFVLWNPSAPPTSKSEKSSKVVSSSEAAADKPSGAAVDTLSGPASEVSHLFAEMVQHGLRCIAFCPSRKLCELVLCLTREILAETAPHLVEAITSYRGGYIAEDRRKIESDLFGGKLCGIAATNALELGIDVGHIDVTLHLGFPGSIASLWQQAGRSGRRQKPSLAVYVAFLGPLDQYYMSFPDKLFGSPIECCHIDSQNKHVLMQHLACAALEHPLSLQYDQQHFGSGLSDPLAELRNKGFLSFDPSRDSSSRIWNYIGREKNPARIVSIRAIETVRYRVMEKKSKDVLDEIEESKAFFHVYEGAIYMNQGRNYLVTSLDIKEKVALCELVNVDYYTRTRDYTDIKVTGGDTAYPVKAPKKPTPQTHACRVTTKWFGFLRIRRRNNEVIDDVELSLPSYTYQSQAVWIQVPMSVKLAVETANLPFRAGLHAACHALVNVVPTRVTCNYSDIAPECPNPQEQRYFPARILVYDRHPGGTGISAKICPLFFELLKDARDLLRSCEKCPPETGCPKCAQTFGCRGYNELLHKKAAIMIMQVTKKNTK